MKLKWEFFFFIFYFFTGSFVISLLLSSPLFSQFLNSLVHITVATALILSLPFLLKKKTRFLNCHLVRNSLNPASATFPKKGKKSQYHDNQIDLAFYSRSLRFGFIVKKVCDFERGEI